MCFARAPPQTDGGYLGVDIETFFSSVTSGASGVFSVTLLEDAGISAGSTLRLSAVTLPESLDWGALTSTMTVGDDGSKTVDPPGSLDALPHFIVSSGCSANTGYPDYTCTGDTTPPCEVSEGGRCVGRPNGYLPNERCDIAVGGGGGGVLGTCAVFDISAVSSDSLNTQMQQGGDIYLGGGGSDCPVGVALAPGDVLRWVSDDAHQGNFGGGTNGCTAKGLCGLPGSIDGLGGGWQICFAA